jgi:integrase
MQVLTDPGATMRTAIEAQARLRHEARDRVQGEIQSLPLWSEYAASLFEAKVAEGRLSSAKTRERWANVLMRLLPVFGRFRVDELRPAHLIEWRDQVGRWIRDGMPSVRKKDAGKNRLVKLSPVTANGWISVLKVICAAMTKHYELARDPARAVDYFVVPRLYTREQPNALTREQLPIFLAKMKELHPAHYAMVLLGFAIGARPSTLRPLRRSGPEADVLWDERVVLLRRSNPVGTEIVDRTKNKVDLEIPLPATVMRQLRAHVDSLPAGPMQTSQYLFPSITGGLRSRSVLDKPFADVLKALRWSIHITPKGMRRTFNDLARQARVHDVVLRAISGHQTERMQRHYSTAQREEMRAAVGKVITSKVISIATARENRQRRAR